MDDVPDEVLETIVFDQLCFDNSFIDFLVLVSTFDKFLVKRWKEILKWSVRDDVKAGQEGELPIEMNIGKLDISISIFQLKIHEYCEKISTQCPVPDTNVSNSKFLKRKEAALRRHSENWAQQLELFRRWSHF